MYIGSLLVVLFIGFQQYGISAEDLGTIFTCFSSHISSHMRMEVDRTKNPDLEPEKMHLNDPSCNATAFNDTFVLFEVPLQGCGTIQDGSNAGFILYSNTAHWDPPSGLITRTKGFRAEITCRYSSDGTASVWFVPQGTPTPAPGKFRCGF
ncbi:zona pellucida sperm-binding protein 2-like [Oculina patagonica]